MQFKQGLGKLIQFNSMGLKQVVSSTFMETINTLLMKKAKVSNFTSGNGDWPWDVYVY